MEYFSVYTKYGEKSNEIVERKEAHQLGICHRVFHLWIINSDNQVLLQQRSANKDIGANLWYASVGGHIESHENMEQAIVREAKEELGLDITELTDSIQYLFTFQENRSFNNGTFKQNEFYDVFVLKYDALLEHITMQESEVQAVKYIDYSDFKNAITQHDFFVAHDMAYKMLLIALDNYLQ